MIKCEIKKDDLQGTPFECCVGCKHVFKCLLSIAAEDKPYPCRFCKRFYYDKYEEGTDERYVDGYNDARQDIVDMIVNMAGENDGK